LISTSSPPWRRFSVDVLGFEKRDDVTAGEDFGWVTMGHEQPELDVTLMTPGPPLDRTLPTSFGASSRRVRWAGRVSASTTAAGPMRS